ncbi:MAG: uroporphyrinogen decarboxylase family protein, partial [Ignavibacteria bacterium]|nr:uroporphyrinogen decarboxylase family protein [Ignavibacteria bacterium]
LHGHDPSWRSRIAQVTSGPDGEEVLWKSGDRRVFPPDDLPRHTPAHPPPRPSLMSLERFPLSHRIEYIPVSQGLRFSLDQDHLFDVFYIVGSKLGNNFSLHGEVTSPFDYYLDLVGVEAGLMGLLESPDAARQVLTVFAHAVADLAGKMCSTGVDAIKISSPYAGAGFISRQQYRDFVLPFERIVASAIERRHVRAYLHTCGAVSDRLEMMMESMVSGIECLDPPPLGNVELDDAKQRMQGKGFIKGNIDPVNLLLSGTEEEVLADAKHRLDVGKEGGGFILSTACSIAPAVPRENVLLLRDAVDRWGEY